jgi:periplasmic copper chaperone A
MHLSLRARRGAAVLGSALAIAAIAAPAAAHVTVPDGADVPSGGNAVIHLRVPHGCDGAATDTISVQLPDGVVSAKAEYVPGWDLAVETVPSAPYDEFGTTKTERVGVITWSGGDLPDAAFYDFGIKATFLLDPGTVVALPVVQKCGDVEVAWIEATVEGQPEPEHPAPTITIGAAVAATDD